jgi:hypothetical protein
VLVLGLGLFFVCGFCGFVLSVDESGWIGVVWGVVFFVGGFVCLVGLLLLGFVLWLVLCCYVGVVVVCGVGFDVLIVVCWCCVWFVCGRVGLLGGCWLWLCVLVCCVMVGFGGCEEDK